MQTIFWIIVAGIAVLALAVVPLLYALWEFAKSQIANTRKLYGRIAEQFDGTVVEGAHRYAPAIRFSHGKLEATVDTATYTTRDERDTRFQIPWPDGHLRCEIHARRWIHRLRRLLYMDDIATDDETFDDAFYVIGNDRDSIRAMLDDKVRSVIFRLGKVRYDDQIYISIQGGMFEARKPGFIDYYETLLGFVQLSLELYDNMVAASGICLGEVVESVSWPSHGGHCLVCGEALTSKVVYCRTCQTPHHADCWKYFGGCATYGCQGKHASPRQRRRRLANRLVHWPRV